MHTSDRRRVRRDALIISSTQYPGYGGAATNAYELIKAARKQGYKAVGVFFHNVEGVNVDPEGIGGVFLYTYEHIPDVVRNDAVSYLESLPTLCLAKNYLAPRYCKEIFGCRTIYLVSGINHFPMYFPEKTGTEVLSNEFQLSDRQVFKAELDTLEAVDVVINNSKISNDIFRKFYPQYLHKIRNGYVDTTATVLSVAPQERKYDIVIACSTLTRKDKNNLFLIDVLMHPSLRRFNKAVVGGSGEAFVGIPNTTVMGPMSHKDCVCTLAQSRVLLFPSKFDSNSNTVREAYKHGCLPLATRNIGYSEIFPTWLLCDSFEADEWIARCLWLLKHYRELTDIRIPFKNGVDIGELIRS